MPPTPLDKFIVHLAVETSDCYDSGIGAVSRNEKIRLRNLYQDAYIETYRGMQAQACVICFLTPACLNGEDTPEAWWEPPTDDKDTDDRDAVVMHGARLKARDDEARLRACRQNPMGADRPAQAFSPAAALPHSRRC